MHLPLFGSRNLTGISEILDGVIVLRIRYGGALAARSRGGVLIQKLLEKLYRKALKDMPSNTPCAIVVEAKVELEDLGLMRAVIGLWNMVTKNGGRLVLVGYPIVTASGRRIRMPPRLPDLALARDFASGLKWVGRPQLEIEGGDAWSHYPGVSRGRSLLPGERFLEEDTESE
jgi:hypothetical protein